MRTMKASVEVATTLSACRTSSPVIESGLNSFVRRSTIKILEVTLKIPPWAYIFSRAPTFVTSVLTSVRPLARPLLLIAACSASASPIQPFSRSSAPTTTIRLFPTASYECKRLVTTRSKPSPRAKTTNSSSARSSENRSCWYS